MYDSCDCSEPDFGYQTGIFAWLEEKSDRFDRWVEWLFMCPYIWVALIPTKRNKRLAEIIFELKICAETVKWRVDRGSKDERLRAMYYNMELAQYMQVARVYNGEKYFWMPHVKSAMDKFVVIDDVVYRFKD